MIKRPQPSRSYVLTTAGHVDHGKSTLLKALTGMEPDRLPEEKQRGMTIDLNFVWYDCPEHGRIGIVDVPGHSRHLKNMTTGLAAVDGFIFLVAADDGWMPQSEEHLHILKGLGIELGLVVISKSDLVSQEELLKLKAELSAKFHEAFHSNVELVTFSANDSQGLNNVRSSIAKLVSKHPPPTEIQGSLPSELWVDRVFSAKGLGYIVTGTLNQGTLSIGQELTLYPNRIPVQIRGMQSYGVEIESARSTTRLALQLSRLGGCKLKRGMFLSTDPEIRLSSIADVLLHPVAPLTCTNSMVSFHFGTARTESRLICMDQKTGIYRLKFTQELPLRLNARFLLRSSNEEKTLATGVIADLNPRRSHREAILEWLTPPLNLAQYLKREFRRSGGVLQMGNQFSQTPWSSSELESDLALFPKISSSDFIDPSLLNRAWNETLAALTKTPSRSLTPPKIKSELSFPFKLESVLALCDYWCKLNQLVRVENELMLPQFKGGNKKVSQLDPQIIEVLAKTKGLPVAVNELSPTLKETVRFAGKSNLIKSLGSDHFMDRDLFLELKEKVKCHLAKHIKASTSEIKSELNLSRKPTVLILEQLDRDRLTYLKDGVRRLLH